MSALSPLAPTMSVESAPTSDEKLRVLWRQRIEWAKEARRPFERIMLSDLAFASGQHWLVYDERQRRMRHIAEVDPRYNDRELFTADRITEYRMAQLGELEADDDRPELLVTQEGESAEEIIEQLNSAVAYAWEHEWRAEQALNKGRRYCVDMGVSAVRCRWDTERGATIGHAPIDQYGNPHGEQAIAHIVEHGVAPDGSLPRYKPVREGATCWEAYSALHLLPPPGCTHEDEFPWEVLARPVPVARIKELYPHLDGVIVEDGDIANLAGVATGQMGRTGQPTTNRLRDHAWLYDAFERPTAAHPRGQVITLASNSMLLAGVQEGFDYELPDGTAHSGVVYLHWWRRSDRFWSGSFITPLKDPQRIINRRETQNLEIIDRGMPRVYVRKGDMPESPTGAPMEEVELSQTAVPPVMFPGAGPGQWMYGDIAHQVDNLGHAATLSAIKLGENPQGVETYSQLALLNDNETSKRATTIRDHRRQIATLVELGVYDIRRYWPESKQILVAGQDDQIQATQFTKALIPDFYMARVAPGAPAPRSQGAQLKMVDSVWAAAVQAWVAVNDGQTWVDWYAECLKAGKVVDLPGAKGDTQRDLAYLENQLMAEGEQPQVMDYDNITVHLPVHREAQDQARAAGDIRTLALIVRHIQEHQTVAQQNAVQVASAAQGVQPPPGLPGAPGSAVPAGMAPAGAGAGLIAPQLPFAPRPREPYPQEIPAAFARLGRGQ